MRTQRVVGIAVVFSIGVLSAMAARAGNSAGGSDIGPAGRVRVPVAPADPAEGAASPRQLDLGARIAAQMAIERIYYSHQLGATAPFEQAVSVQAIENKVRLSLQQSAALERFWKTPITGEALRAEMQRIASNTRFPERLREIYEALGNDSVLVQEALARPTLAARLSRNFFWKDQIIHASAQREAEVLRKALTEGTISLAAESPRRIVTEVPRGTVSSQPLSQGVPATVGEVGPVVERRDSFIIRALLSADEQKLRIASWSVPKQSWDEWWSGVSGEIDEASVPTVAREGEPLPAPGGGTDSALSAGCLGDDSWHNGHLDDFLIGRSSPAAVWTGTEMLIWGGVEQSTSDTLNDGARYDPVTDTWTLMSRVGAPEARNGHQAVWTGTRMLIWGGYNYDHFTATGARYDPVSDTWSPMSTANQPGGRWGWSVVWTGSKMIVWGGADGSFTTGLNTGGQYDAASDSWTPTTTTNAPSPRQSHVAVWTGSEMIVWSGHSSDGFTNTWHNDGGRYNPQNDSWAPLPILGAPEPRQMASAVWTGSRMLVWGGIDETNYFNTGGRYDPGTNSWQPMSLVNAPSGRYSQGCVWTSREMVVWGGADPYLTTTGGAYDPIRNRWRALSTVNAPEGRWDFATVWTGKVLIAWGGHGYGWFNTGGRYDPTTDVWTPTYATDATPRFAHSAVWDGNRVLLWGGANPYTVTYGERYDPMLDAWSVMSSTNAPAATSYHTAIWTGARMIVWGGMPTGTSYVNTGGLYDPIADSWTPTSQTNAPVARAEHTAVWTGNRMIVWGGSNLGGYQSSGGRYDPVNDTWLATSLLNPPVQRSQHTGVWTGSRMLIWGGHRAGQTYINTGSRYDPTSDSWLAMSATNAPSARARHTAIWTGTEMIVWGGGGGDETNFFQTGGRYDPASNSWTATQTVGAPAARDQHTAVWTGSEMIVWGGSYGYNLGLGDGGRYKPSTNTWTTLASRGEPELRYRQSAVWTGDTMMVWAGFGSGRYLVNGGIYAAGHPDADHDGVADACDCSPSNASAFATPAEVTDLDLWPAAPLLRWDSTAPTAGTGTVHDVVRGGLDHLPVGSSPTETCLVSGTAAISADDPQTPASGKGFWYLARGRNACAAGTYGTTSSGAQRISLACP